MRLRLLCTVVVLASVLAGACASSSSLSEGCRLAAESQALAEQRWGQEIEAHNRAHETVAKDASAHAHHDESAGLVLGARVEMILAEAETRRSCS